MKTQEEIYRAYVTKILRQIDDIIKKQSANVGSFISTDGKELVWSAGGGIIPPQTGQAGKFLSTDGTTTSWSSVVAPTWGAITGTLSSQTDLQTALNAKEATANKGAINGYASLDGSGLVPATQLPSYVDDVLEYANLAAFPVTGSTGKIYVALDTNFVYRWSGSAYIQITSATVGGSNTQVQFNNNGTLGGSDSLTWNGTQLKVDNIVIAGASNAITNNEGFASWSTVLNGGGGLYNIRYNSASKLAITSTGATTITPDTLTGSAATSALDISQTWNTTGTPTALKLNITDTASGISSLMFDIQKSGASMFNIGRQGTLRTGAVNTPLSSLGPLGVGGYGAVGSNYYLENNALKRTANDSASAIDFSSGGFLFKTAPSSGAGTTISWNTQLTLDINGITTFTPANSTATSGTVNSLSHTSTFAAPAGSANFRPVSINYTINNSGAQTGTATGLLVNATQTALNGMVNNLMDLQVGGVSKHSVDNMGRAAFGGAIVPGAWLTIRCTSGTDGLRIENTSGTLIAEYYNAEGGGEMYVRDSAGTTKALISSVGSNVFSLNSAASAPNITSTGTWFSGGTSTTTKPHVLIEPTGTTSTNWSTSGTALGINAATGFLGNFVDFQVNGANIFRITSTSGVIINTGNLTMTSGNISVSGDIVSGQYLGVTGKSWLRSATNGNWTVYNNAVNDFGLFQFGGTTSSFPALKRSGTGITVRLADDSAESDITAAKVISTNVVRLKGYTVATLPAGTVGDTAYVTDLLAPTFGAIAVGGGAVVYKVFFNGTNWIT